ncbi:hypothetical protein M404DRAFT_17855 [Pisolithus tinctorius Marx 270]|uniref:DUF4939 domain-containing protein n=1 Tax=Pisolithus tinctorius Marx 270 TaxID=870435 RepID=A0A0C3PZ11_PISTI|nr:hypothetical protein M404DRAFT_17855 [Pisolithus tinctorius Marx 270]
MPTQTRTQAAQACATTNPDSTSAINLCCTTALVSLGTARRLPNDEPDPDEADDFNPSGDDPGDDGPGNNGPGDDLDNDDEEPLPEDDVKPGVAVLDNLAKAIELLTHNACTSSESSSRTKLCELDTFNRTDPKKLHTFLIQCELNFWDQPQAFQSDQTKVTFMQSFLKGMALEWFELDLLGTEDLEDIVKVDIPLKSQSQIGETGVGNEFEFPRRIRLGQEFRGGRTCFISCLCFCVCTPGLGDEQPRR